ncbi:hypothetical protein Godav_020901 [Gossypium davidsonii]|uniref:Uncharacterized protein n=1 Tax=Gossypium davidsonii TaxID=34287 RepID=A0A7J8R5U2_GOSDV|nr:hypothetical protein [Gossypium davidsonii]
METQDTHIPSSMWRVYNHTGGRAITTQVTSGWVDSDGLSFLYRLESCMQPTVREGSSNARKITKSCTFKVTATTCGPKRSGPTQLGINGVDDIESGDAWYRLPFLRPRVDYPYTISLVEPWAELCGTTEGALRYTTPFRSTTESGVYVMVEINKFDRVLRQFRFRQMILLPPQYIGDLHKIDLRERTEDGWAKFHGQYINIWEHKYDILLNCEQIIARELAVDSSIQGLEQVPKWVHHRHQHNKRYYCLHNILVSMARLILVQIQIEGKIQKLTIVGATTEEKRQSTSNGVLRGWQHHLRQHKWQI